MVMDDIRKLENIIDALEGQTRQVAEYSGLLSAINGARAEIADCSAVMQSSATAAKSLVSESRDHLTRLNESLSSLERENGKFAAENRAHLDRLNFHLVALDGEHRKFVLDSNRAFERLEGTLLSLDESIRAVADSNGQISSAISSLDFVTPSILKDGLTAIQADNIENFRSIRETVLELSKRQESAYRIALGVFVVLIAFDIAFAIFLFGK